MSSAGMPSVMHTTSGDARVGRLHDGIGGERRRHEDHGRVGAGLAHGLRHGVEHRQVQVRGAALARAPRRPPPWCRRRWPAARGRCLPCPVKPCTISRVLRSTSMLIARPPASATTFSAASFMPSATVKLKPDSARILRPSSTLVPSMRTTMGTWMFSSRAAATTPVASVSQRRMPPKMLISTAFTFLSESRMRKALLHLLGAGAAAHVQEVGRAAAGVLDDVHGGHGQARAVHHAAHRAVELDVVQAVARGLHFERILFVEVAQLEQFLVAVERVVVEVDLGVERVDLAVLGEDERVDLGERGVHGEIRLGERHHGRDGGRSRWPAGMPMPKASLRAWNGGQARCRAQWSP